MNVIVYRAKDGWRWHMKARNQKIICESGEAYASKSNAWRAWWRVKALVRGEAA